MASEDTIRQLNSARDIVLRDPAIYPQIVPGVLPVIGASQPLGLRRWGADFLAETFASPVVSPEDKEKMCLGVLDTLQGYLNRKEQSGGEEDVNVLKSAIQCFASIYPYVFRYVVTHAEESVKEVWAKVMGMKSGILRRMDSAPAGVRICCIKFVARVVQVQTPGLIADPRKPDQNEVSLALVPREHAILVPSNLEAEASGLLDRLLTVLEDNPADALTVTSTLNALSPLIHRRASISTKILATILSFNPVQTGKDRLNAKSMTRTTISLLNNVLKRIPTHTLALRIQNQIDRLRHLLAESLLDQPNALKRGPDEPIDGLHANKRLQLDAEASGAAAQQRRADGPLPLGPVSFKDLYTLTADPRAAGFHVGILPEQIVAQLVPPLLQNVNSTQFDQALNLLRTRILELQRRPLPSAVDAARVGPGDGIGDEEDEEYDPNVLGIGETDQVNPITSDERQGHLRLEVMKLPAEPPLNENERLEYGEHARQRLFGTLRDLDDELDKKRAGKAGVAERERIGGFGQSMGAGIAGHERESWITLLVRMATRSAFETKEGADDEEEEEDEAAVKRENDDRSLATKTKSGQHSSSSFPDKIRDALQTYIMYDWRRRIDTAIAWLNEEWYTERLSRPASSTTKALPTYTHLTLSTLDQLTPYLDTKDGRYLIRFLSEVPHLPAGIFPRIKKIAEDPERVQLACQALLYLIMLRPPVREAAIQCAREMWRENRDARTGVEKILVRWAPDELKGMKQEAEEGVKGE
ncbi:hypothetical protein BDY17DRAFT_300727 [Neohortaea acidophila]|uniref:Symplekin/Pta1 N-terminal domain-containing protein n=1 Tax=Neohortaea acidophila TaxID=245834 RepID=A0A6A6PMA6_9PEZI|nr:uncharacterized protein BDY17DRAFT_300727 [Neohortaea acidophila]KAF2481122.1 hypothetical protein BDY17DRAFT_300727 [Neohortaea acidophila]